MVYEKKYFIALLMLLLFYPFNYVYADRTIKDGTYTIKSALDTNKVLDSKDGKAFNNTNVQLYQSNNTNAQKWKLVYENGYYSIISTIDNKYVFDINYGEFRNSSNIQLYQSNNTIAQKWNIIHVGNSNFVIKSTNSNYCIDVSNASTKNGSNIQLYKCNNTNAQKFKFLESVTPTKDIDDGYYTINSFKDSSKGIEVKDSKIENKSNIQLRKQENSSNQIWYIKYLNNGYYSIHSRMSKKKCMDVANGVFVSGSNIQLYSCNNTDSQMWIIKKTADGNYNIISKKELHALDVQNGVMEDGANIQLFYQNGTDAQKFILNKIEVDEKQLENGTYTIKSMLNKNKVLDISGGNATENNNVQIYQSNNTNAQKWYITKNIDGSYNIKSGMDSNLFLSVDGTNAYVSSKITNWELEFVDENTFYVKEKSSGKYLNLENNNTNDSSNINLVTDTVSNAQVFYFEETSINEQLKTIDNGYYSIGSNLDSSFVLDAQNGSKYNGTNVQLYKSNKSNAQIWYFKFLGNGYYSITSAMNPNVSLDLANGSISNGTNIQLYKSNLSDAQQWKLIDDKYGSIIIRSKKSNICLTLNNSSVSNGTNIQANTCDNLKSQNYKLSRYVGKKSYTGIDVSKYQGTIDWAKLASTNIGFVMIRAGWGDNWTSQDDGKFKEYVAGCEKYNIPYGVYLYSYAKNTTGSTALNANSESAQSEAAHVMRLVNSVSYKPNLKNSVYIDMEEPKLEYLGKSKLTNITNTFCSSITSSGYGCGVYASSYYLNTYLDAPAIASKYKVWLAEWPTGVNTFSGALARNPGYKATSYKLWQFSDNGVINGVNGSVDLDLGYDIFDN